MSTAPSGALLVGSVPLDDAEQVFRTASELLGPQLERIPDGETGDRLGWVGWQLPVFADHPQLVPEVISDRRYAPQQRFIVADGVAPEAVRFDALGYTAAALASYERFAALKRDGVVPDRIRFQVCLPTPLAPTQAFVAPPLRAAIGPAYERAMLAELEAICAAIPHDQLAIQWDIAVELGMLEGIAAEIFEPWFDDVETTLVERIARISEAVPTDVELGHHLCYGDYGHTHFKQPEDAGHLATLGTGLAAAIARPIAWLHLPVPRDRADDAYYAPLSQLRLHPETKLYLGLIHMTDGADGARARIAAASRAVPSFGVATECGFGRRPSKTVAPLLELHRELVGSAGDR